MKLSVFYDHMREAARQTGHPIEEIASEVRSFGITGVEVMEAQLLEDREGILRILKGAGLSVNCICCYGDFGNDPNPDRAYAMIDLAKNCGSPKVLVIPGFLHEGDCCEKHLDNMKAVLTKMCAYAQEQGIVVGMEDYDDKSAPFSTCAQLKWFMENVPGMSCMFDTGNFLYSEEDVLEAFEQLEPWIHHGIHCKDRTWERHAGEEAKTTIQGRDMYACAVGSGCLPIKEIVTRLLKKGFSGSFTIEHFGALDQLACMRESANWLLSLENSSSK